MQYWVIEGLLARSARPGYTPGEERTVPREDVLEWTEAAKAFGVRSIICILDADQLPLYHFALPDGLIEHYRGSGFDVVHITARDGREVPLNEDQKEQIWAAFQTLPKPVLVHCSAGHDRTGIAVQHILAQLEERDPIL
jgi:hypothetical protein